MEEVHRVHQGDIGYPKRLAMLGRAAPGEIYIRGGWWVPEPLAVGIVGARKASEAGRDWSFRLAKLAGQHGLAVVSGGAFGIDRAAHEGALAGKARTAVVLPSPVDAPVPYAHRGLFMDVLAHGGTLLSEHGVRLRHRAPFATRNRLIAALSDVVVVVEAGERSGTRHTVKWGQRLGRLVGFVRWADDDSRGAGGRAVGGAWRVSTVEEILRVFGDMGSLNAKAFSSRRLSTQSARSEARIRPSKEVATPDVELTPERAALLKALCAPATFDGLMRHLGVSAEVLTRQLLEAEMSGEVERAGGRWRRCRS